MNADPYVHFDGAYVLGALDPQEHAEFEAHLATCDACQARVDEVRPTAGLLSGLTEAAWSEDLPAAGPMPETLLPGLLRRVAGVRTRQRWMSGAIAALAAACLVTIAVLVWPNSPTSSSGPRAQALTALRSTPVTAVAAVVSKKWGTEIDVTCRYADEVEPGRPYELRVIDSNGTARTAGSWTLVPGNAITFKAATALPRNQISKIQITMLDGTPILQLKL